MSSQHLRGGHQQLLLWGNSSNFLPLLSSFKSHVLGWPGEGIDSREGSEYLGLSCVGAIRSGILPCGRLWAKGGSLALAQAGKRAAGRIQWAQVFEAHKADK